MKRKSKKKEYKKKCKSSMDHPDVNSSGKIKKE
jgi:hypothetical protein